MSKELTKIEMDEAQIITANDLVAVKENALNDQQLRVLMGHTPKKHIKSRPAKGGGTWQYVTGNYVQKTLNMMFGWDWDFEIVDERITTNEAIVKGRLTCRVNGRQIVKTQYGNKDIMCKRGTEIPLSLGNDLKAAATDALKKCAAQIGLAADVYAPDDFESVDVGGLKPMELTSKFDKWKDVVAWVGKGGKRSDLEQKYTVSDAVWQELQKQARGLK